MTSLDKKWYLRLLSTLFFVVLLLTLLPFGCLLYTSDAADE